MPVKLQHLFQLCYRYSYRSKQLYPNQISKGLRPVILLKTTGRWPCEVTAPKGKLQMAALLANREMFVLEWCICSLCCSYPCLGTSLSSSTFSNFCSLSAFLIIAQHREDKRKEINAALNGAPLVLTPILSVELFILLQMILGLPPWSFTTWNNWIQCIPSPQSGSSFDL